MYDECAVGRKSGFWFEPKPDFFLSLKRNLKWLPVYIRPLEFFSDHKAEKILEKEP